MKRELLTLYNIVDMFDEELNYTLNDMELADIQIEQIKNAWGQFLDTFYGQTVGYITDDDIEDYYEEEINYE